LTYQTSCSAGRILAFDIGGSHVAAALCSVDSLCLGPLAIGPLCTDASLERFLDLIHDLGSRASERRGEPAGAVFAIPGPFDYLAGISKMRHKLPSLYGVDLRHTLAERFGWAPDQFHFINDADAFLLGELGAGAAQGAERAVGITLGTGIGSAFARNNVLLIGEEEEGVPSGGEIWDLAYEGGTVEDLLSTAALQLDYRVRTGRQMEVAAIAAAAETDPDAREAFERFGRHLGLVLRDILAPFAPDVVVLGGGISRSDHLFLPAAQKSLAGHGFRLVTSGLFGHAPMIGAGVYWRQRIRASIDRGSSACTHYPQPA